MVGDSSTVMTPSLPTLSNASAMSSPILASWAEIVATWAISLLVLDLAGALEQRSRTTAAAAASMPRLSAIGFGAGGDVAQALVDHRLGEHGRGGGAVTGDVVGLGGDLLGQLGAEVLVRVLQLDLTGDGDAVVGDRRRAPLLVDDDVAAARAERHLDGVGERVHAALERAPRVLVELQDLGHVVPQIRSISGWSAGIRHARRRAAGARSGVARRGRRDYAAWNCAYFSMTASTSRAESTRYSSPFVLDLGAAVLAVEDDVADLDVERNALGALVVEPAGTDGEDLALLGLLLGGVRDDQAGRGGLLGLERAGRRCGPRAA